MEVAALKARTQVDRGLKAIKWLAFGVPTQVLLETWKHQRELIDDWPTVHDHWIDLYLSLSSKYSEEELASRHLFVSYLTLLRNLVWHTTAVLSGAYESAARDLRYLLEETCQALYLDTTYPGRTLEEVYDIVENNRAPRGRGLIRSLKLPDSIKSEMSEVYDRLSDYAHPSHKMLLENVTDSRLFCSTTETGSPTFNNSTDR